jgi:hypothetical protein
MTEKYNTIYAALPYIVAVGEYGPDNTLGYALINTETGVVESKGQVLPDLMAAADMGQDLLKNRPWRHMLSDAAQVAVSADVSGQIIDMFGSPDVPPKSN